MFFISVTLKSWSGRKFLDLTTYHLRTKFYMPSCNVALVVAIILKAKENIFTPSLLLFHILKRHYLNNSCKISKIHCCASFQSLKIDGIIDNVHLVFARSL